MVQEVVREGKGHSVMINWKMNQPKRREVFIIFEYLQFYCIAITLDESSSGFTDYNSLMFFIIQ